MSEAVLQFGAGRFLRAFVDRFIQQANDDGQIVGQLVVVQSPGQRAELTTRPNQNPSSPEDSFQPQRTPRTRRKRRIPQHVHSPRTGDVRRLEIEDRSVRGHY